MKLLVILAGFLLIAGHPAEENDDILTKEEIKTIKKTLKKIPIISKSISCNALKWQKKQVKAFNNLSQKWNKKKLGEELYDSEFVVAIKSLENVEKIDLDCSSDKPKLCKFFQEFMAKKLDKLDQSCKKEKNDEIVQEENTKQDTFFSTSILIGSILSILIIVVLIVFFVTRNKRNNQAQAHNVLTVLEKIFSELTDDANVMDINELFEFMKNEQGEKELTIEKCKEMVQNLGASSYTEIVDHKSQKTSKIYDHDFIEYEGFEKIITSKQWGNIEDKKQLEFDESSMNYPIVDYYISSSHNTYLSGHQLYGESKVEMYADFLRQGGRCVELDCWNSDDGTHPIIYHGYTQTTKILFEDVVKAINDNAFVTSEYPVILSIENHCNVENQSRMAKIFKEVFGKKLVTELVDGKNCPTPNMLKNKIIIKAKKLKEDEQALLEEKEEDDEISNCEFSDGIENLNFEKEKIEVKLSQELSQLVIYNRARHFKNFKDAKENSTCHHVSSFVETKVEKLASDYLGFVNHTNFQMVRVYPAGTRVGSDNYKKLENFEKSFDRLKFFCLLIFCYDPVVPWALGCQLVALNWQTTDKSQLINISHFKMNGNTGWVLKPENIRKNRPWSQNLRNLRIQVISGNRFLRVQDGISLSHVLGTRRHIVNPYVSFELVDYNPLKSGYLNRRQSMTDVIENDGCNPVWNTGIMDKDLFRFENVNPDTGFLIIKVKSSSEDLGRKVVPLKILKTGYRHVFFEEIYQKVNFANVLMHLKWELPWKSN